MFQISQIFISNFGYRDAFFPSRLIDLRKEEDVASSVMLFAENGRGKTSFLSMMLHMFVPQQEKFVQRLQKKQSHRFDHYFQDGKPCLYMVEFVRQPKGQLFTKKEPALVLGVYARKMGDNRVDETFFKFTPVEGMQFDDLEPVRMTRSGERHDWSYAETTAWIKRMKSLSEEKEGLVFRTFDVQKLWTEALADEGFRLNDYNTMLAMATREGGLDAFMTCKDSSDMLGKIHELFVNEAEYADEIAQINYVLEKNKELPAMRSQRDAMEIALEKERLFVESLFVAETEEEGLRKIQRQLKGLRLVSGAKRNVLKEKLVEARALETEIAEHVRKLDASRVDLQHRAEASRIAIAAAGLADAEAAIAGATETRNAANRKKQVFDRIHKDARRRIDLEAQAGILEQQIAERQEKQASRLEPVRKAGSRARAVIESSIATANLKIARCETRRKELKGLFDNLNITISTMEAQRAVMDVKLQQVEALLAQRSEVRGKIETVVDGNHASLPDYLAAIAKEISGLEDAVAKARDRRQEASVQKGKLEVEIAQLRRELESHQKTTNRLSSQVDALRAIDSELRGGLLKQVTADDVPDLLSDAFYAGLTGQRGEFAARAEQLRGEGETIKSRLATIEGAGSFEDDDVMLALSLCQASGLTSVRPFVLWLSELNLEAEEARTIVENNIDVALGLIVTDEPDFAKAKAVFDREAWRLKKPVGLSLLDNAFYERLTSQERDPNFFAFSAHNDYAYNSRSKVAVIEQLQALLERKTGEREELLSFVGIRDALTSNLDTMRKLSQGKSIEVIVEERDIARARHDAAMEREDESAVALDAQIAAVQTADDELAEYLASIASLNDAAAPLHELQRLSDKIEGDFVQIGDFAEISEQNTSLLREVGEKRLEIGRIETEMEALVTEDRQHSGQVCELTYRRDRIEHFESETSPEIEGWSLDEAVRQYDLAKIEYDRDQDIADLVNMDTQNLNAARNEVLALHTVIEKAFRDIARELQSPESELRAILTEWLSGDPADFDSAVSELHLAITAADATIKTHTERKAILQREAQSRSGFDAGKLKTLLHLIRDRSINELQALDTSTHSELSDTIALFDARTIKRRTVIEEIARLVEADKELGRLEKSLAKARWDAVEPASALEVNFDNVDAAVAHIEELIEREEKLNDAFSRLEKEANKAHSNVVAYVLEQEAVLRMPEVIEKFRRFDATNYRSRGNSGKELYQRLGQLGEVLTAEIELLSDSEQELLVVVGRLFEHALDKILKAVSIKVPSHAKSQFAGHAILQLPEKLTAKALKEYPVEDVARRCINAIRDNNGAPRLTSMAALSVQLLNIVSQALKNRDFELMILKPVVGARIQYDILHKMTGSGGQTITAALLLYLVATNIAGRSSSDELLGFLILDNPIGPANNSQLVQTQLSSAKDFGVQMISTTGILDDYLSAYEMVVQFSASAVRQGLTEVDFEVIATGGTEIDFFEFELHSAADAEAA